MITFRLRPGLPAPITECLIAAALSLLALPAWAQPSAGAAAISPAKRITVAAEYLPLDHLLRKVSRQSGLTLDVDPDDPLSAMPLTVYLTDVRTDTVCAALTNLLSARHAPWRWERRDDRPGSGPEIAPAAFKPGIAYRLRPSPGAKVYAVKTRARIVQDISGYKITPNQRSPEELPASPEARQHMQDVDKARSQLAVECLQSLVPLLTPEEQRRLLSLPPPFISLERLDSELVRQIRAETERYIREPRYDPFQPNGSKFKPPPVSAIPTGLVLFTGDPDFTVVPSFGMAVYVAEQTRSDDSHPYERPYDLLSLAGFDPQNEKHWREILTAEWTPRPDKNVPIASPAALDSLPLQDLPPMREWDGRSETSVVASVFARLHEAVEKKGNHINLLVRLTRLRNNFRDPLLQVKTVAEARKRLAEQQATASRWFVPATGTDVSPKNGEAILLMNSLNGLWKIDTNTLAPPRIWDRYVALRHVNPHGYLTFDDLCELAGRLPLDAFRSLFYQKEDDEDVAPTQKPLPPAYGLASALETDYLCGLLAFLGRNPVFRKQIQTAEGIDIADPENAALVEEIIRLIANAGLGKRPETEEDSREMVRQWVGLRVTTVDDAKVWDRKQAVKLRVFNILYKAMGNRPTTLQQVAPD